MWSDVRCPVLFRGHKMSRVRTLGTKIVATNVQPPEWILERLRSQRKTNANAFPFDSIRNVKDPVKENTDWAISSKTLQGDSWLARCQLGKYMYMYGCGPVKFHYDEVRVNEYAYVCWVLDVVQGSPVFHLGENHIELKSGDLIVFDAYHLHACLPKKEAALRQKRIKMFFALGSVKLTPMVRQALGIRLESIKSEWTSMMNVAYDPNSGMRKTMR